MTPSVLRRASMLAASLLLLTTLVGGHALAAVSSAEDTIGGVTVSDDPGLVASVPAVSMPAGVLWTGEGRPLWERHADDERAMASTTKIMTAVVVLDVASPDDLVTVPAAAVKVGESQAGLVAGERLTVRQLLEATLVRSGNDAAYALAEHVAGSQDAFVELMNRKAADLGLTHTSFANPHGLDAPGHHTSARDLAALSIYAMKNPTFAEIVGERAIVLKGTGAPRRFENSNRLLVTYEGVDGVKTGWTNKAGYCVVVSAQRGPVDLVAVVLGTASEKDRFAQARTLLDWGFEHYAVRQLSSAEQTVAAVAVAEYLDVTIPAVVGETTSAPVFDLAGPVESRVEVAREVDAPVSAGDRLGTYIVSQAGQVLAEVPIVAAHDVRKPDLLRAVGIFFTRAWRMVFGGRLVAEPVLVM